MSGTGQTSLVLVGGAINTDLVATVARAPEAGETVTGTSFATYGGGKGANQAVAACRSAARVAMLGAVGDDAFGQDRRRELELEGIDVSRVSVDPSVSSGVALIFVEQHGENRIAYVPGSTLTVDARACVSAVDVLRPTHVLAPNEFPPDALFAFFGAARECGAHVTLNAAPEPDTVEHLLHLVDLLIVNQAEARTMIGGKHLDPADMARALLELGPKAAIVTAGPLGAYGATEGESIVHEPPAVDVVDTTGAGDTFCGACVAAIMAGADLSSACAYAVTASALSVRTHGAQPSIPRRNEIRGVFEGT